MKFEYWFIFIGIIILAISFIVINVMAFNVVEGKILKAMDKKCTTSIQVINNITNINPQTTQSNSAVVRSEEEEREEEEEDDD